MPLEGDFAGVRRLERSLQDLARPGGASQAQVARGVIGQVRELLREQFAAGVGPDGSPLQLTVRGQPALVSRKLPQAFTGQPVPGGASMSLRIEWLEAHQHGHVFAAGRGGKQALRFVKGALVSERRFFRASSGRTVFTREHVVGARTLPARPIIPEGTIPPRWARGIGQGATDGMQRWYERATK